MAIEVLFMLLEGLTIHWSGDGRLVSMVILLRIDSILISGERHSHQNDLRSYLVPFRAGGSVPSKLS